jgi:hypothetical protein
MKSWGVLWLGLGVALVWPLTSQGTTRYVAPGGNHTTPFTNWVTAATNIQAAIDVSSAGDLVWVTNGTYQTGGRVASGSATTNRVVIDKAITVKSVNGPLVTVIRGAFQPGGTNGNGAIRCVWMTNNAVLVGFTLTNGATRASDYGGGIWCQSTAAYISNCFIVGNAADAEGGGVLFGSLQFCTLAGNAASLGGGASGSQLTLCNVTSNRASVGGGVLLGTLALCQLFGNQATTFGGGVSGGTLTNCTLLGNVSGNQGGGAYAATLNNSLVLQNSAPYGGGVAKGTLHQCNVISNSAAQAGGGAYTSTLNRCRVIGNIAIDQGGGACQSTLNNSVLEGNFAANYGGGAVSSSVVNCTFTRNGSGQHAGGTHLCQVANSIVYFNLSGIPGSEDDLGSSFTNSCTSADPGGTGNITTDPRFILLGAGNLRLLPSSPCLNTGSNALATGALDLDGNARTNGAVVDMGAYELGYHYVAQSNPTPVAPYLTWGTAATSIQDAVDAAYVGSAILVSNGVYDTGARTVPGSSLSNRVVVDKALLLKSVNGPKATVIFGDSSVGDDAVRGVWLTNGAALIGFTLTNGGTRASGDDSTEQGGGGAWCQSAAVLISDCQFVGNAAGFQGGGSFGGTIFNSVYRGNQAATGGGASFINNPGSLNNCLLTGNAAGGGGGAREGTLNHCTVAGNYAWVNGGGVSGGTLQNCIVYFNTAGMLGPNHYGSALAYSCTTPDPGGTGNITADPEFRNRAGGDYRLKYASPCADIPGVMALAGPTDLDGNPRLGGSTQDLGAYEIHVFYALPGNTFAAYPYTTFFTGASNLQEAVDAAYTGGVVLAATGVYDQGGRPAAGSLLTNRVVIEKPLEVIGLSFPTAPVIQGSGPAGDNAVRCAWLGEEVYLRNFILSNGATRASGDPATEQSGGGAWASNELAVVDRCWLVNNTAVSDGGGAMGGKLMNCLIRHNTAGFGGGASFYFAPGNLINCTIVTNTAGDSGGVYGGSHVNCIVLFNQASTHSNHDAAAFTYSCLSPNPGGTGNMDANPLFKSTPTNDFRIYYSSPCLDAGDTSVVESRGALDGRTRISGDAVDIGAYEVGYTYVDVANPTPVVPYASWGSAATTIQEAVNMTLDGDIVLVAHGVYETGGVPAPSSALTNRVCVLKQILVKSVNGPTVTTIRGQGPIGDNAIRCVYLTSGATLEGFTLTNGATRASGDVTTEQCGGGVYGSLDINGVSTISRCIIANNTAEAEGGGVSGGLVNNSVLKGNSASYGGGASFTYTSGFMNNCTVVGNSSLGAGGGVKGGVAVNSIVYNNFGSGNPNYDTVFFAYSCTTPDPAGDHCITNHPKFENAAAGNYRLNFTSPCLEAGYNFEAALPTDLDGNARILGNTVEMGAYEYMGNAVDSDADGYVDHEELIAGTQPTNSASYFRVDSVLQVSGVPAFMFNSVSGRVYTIETRDSLLALPDWAPATVYTSLVDFSLTALPGVTSSRFSRVKVSMAPPP